MGACCSQEMKHRKMEPDESWDLYSEITLPYEGIHPPAVVHQDMTLPLSCYFVSSGHNSYLTGNQINSDSGTATIEMSLKRGCRVIELDAYNQQAGFTGPVCKHGGMLTAPVSFKMCVQSIQAYAFVVSPYPVIITIENHTDEEGQHQMAEILQEVLGSTLYVPDSAQHGLSWQSPQALKHKVLIRTNLSGITDELMRSLVYIPNIKFRGLQPANSAGQTSSSSFVEQQVQELLKEAFTTSNLVLKPRQRIRVLRGEGRPMRSLALASVQLRRVAAHRHRLGRQSGAPRLDKSMIDNNNRGASDSHAVVDQQEAPYSPTAMVPSPAATLKQTVTQRHEQRHEHVNVQLGSDRVEAVVDTVVEEEVEVVQEAPSLGEVYAYTSHALMRVYPAGLRLDSSNYNPMRAWCLGASLAALNWQTWDRPLWINQAMFAQNGNCGYVLKPSWMRRLAVEAPGHPVPPLSSIPSDPLPMRGHPRLLHVQLLTAFCKQKHKVRWFTRRDIDVQVTLYGMPMDWQGQRLTSARAWPRAHLIIDQMLEIPMFHADMAILMITLLDVERNDAVLGHWECPLATLAPGSYKVELTDRHGVTRHDRWLKLGLSWAPQCQDSVDSGLLETEAVVAALTNAAPKNH